MSERINETTGHDAPLSAAYSPDARASGLSAAEGDELIARTFTINRPRADVRAHLRQSFNLVDFLADDDADDASITVEDDSDEGITWRATTSGGRESSGRISRRSRGLRRSYSASTALASSGPSALARAGQRSSAISTSARPEARTFRYHWAFLPKPEMTTAWCACASHDSTSSIVRWTRPVRRPRCESSRKRCPSSRPAPTA